MDSDSRRIEKLEKGDIPFFEPGIAELVAKGVKEGRLSFTTSIAQAAEKALVIFIAVGTPPSADGSADLSFVKEVGKGIAQHMSSYKVIVTKSTVPVGTGETIREVIKKTQKSPIRFDIVSNPEFLREGSAIEDFMRPNRVVIGVDSDQAIAIMKDLYRPLYLIETPIVVTDVPTAELIKYASNAFLATKISFINEIANLCEKVGANVRMVAKGMGLDHRIGAKFLHAGPGFGGSCFPKDLAALIQTSERNGYPMQIAAAALQVNENQRRRMVDKVREAIGGVNGKTVAFLGLSFKPNTNDLREAPALAIARALVAEGATIRAYDPEALAEACQTMPELQPSRDAYDAAEGADALVIMTEWNVFRNLEFEQLKSAMRTPLIIDLRNVYDPERVTAAGFWHVSVGRAAGSPPKSLKGLPSTSRSRGRDSQQVCRL